jgi:predicted glycosyltransferase
VEDGPAPAGHQVDVLEPAEGRVIPSLLTRVTHARGDAVIAQRSALRIAIYSQDGLGLGHLRRTTLIGQRLLDAAPDSAVLLVVDSPVGPIFALPDGMDCVKLPSILKVDAGQWRPTSLPIPTADLQRLRSELLYHTLVEYQPDLVLVDHMPGGAQGELRPALDALRQEQPACRIVLGLRDVLDAPHVTRRVWQDEGAYEVLRQYYDAVLIYGNRELFDTAATYQIPAPPGGIHYCGYVVNGAQATGERRQATVSGPALSPAACRLSPESRLVFVSAGGGGDGHRLMQTYLRALRHLGSRVDFATLMAIGVNAPPAVRQELHQEAEGLPVQIVSHVDDGMSAMAAADLVVCMAGYNTLAEVLQLGRKALVVPRAGPSAEQQMRCRLFEQRNLIDVLYPGQLSPQTLAERLVRDLERDDYPARDGAVDTHGVYVAAYLLRSLAGARAYGQI